MAWSFAFHVDKYGRLIASKGAVFPEAKCQIEYSLGLHEFTLRARIGVNALSVNEKRW